jgi:hypothetical protein
MRLYRMDLAYGVLAARGATPFTGAAAIGGLRLDCSRSATALPTSIATGWRGLRQGTGVSHPAQNSFPVSLLGLVGGRPNMNPIAVDVVVIGATPSLTPEFIAGRGVERREVLWFRGEGAGQMPAGPRLVAMWVIRPLDALAITSCHAFVGGHDDTHRPS